MNAARLSTSRRQESGQSQADYCRARGLDPKHLIVPVRTLMGCYRP